MISRDEGETGPEEGSSEAETMRYAMLGQDDSTTREKLEKFTGVVDWSYLKPHFQAGVLIYVDPGLDLTTVGEAFSADLREQVEVWMKSGDLVKPSQPHAAFWEESQARFTALVVSPFVLVQPAPAGEPGEPEGDGAAESDEA